MRAKLLIIHIIIKVSKISLMSLQTSIECGKTCVHAVVCEGPTIFIMRCLMYFQIVAGIDDIYRELHGSNNSDISYFTHHSISGTTHWQIVSEQMNAGLH